METVSADRPEAFEGSVNFVPEIVAGECDMSPGKRCDLGEQLGGNIDALGRTERCATARRGRPSVTPALKLGEQAHLLCPVRSILFAAMCR